MFQKILNLFKRNGQPNTGNGEKILLIEDSEIDRKVVINALENSNYNIVTANDGQTGLDMVKTDRPDLILLDGALPDIEGAVVCKRLKDDENFKKIPIIFLTGSDSPYDIVDFYDAGAEHYLKKPISAKELIGQIEITLKNVAI